MATAEASGLFRTTFPEFFVVIRESNPDLDTDFTIGGMGRIVSVINRLTESMKGENTFTVFFITSDFSTADTSLGPRLAAFSACMPDALDSFLLNDTVRTALFDLMSNILGNKPCI